MKAAAYRRYSSGQHAGINIKRSNGDSIGSETSAWHQRQAWRTKAAAKQAAI